MRMVTVRRSAVSVIFSRRKSTGWTGLKACATQIVGYTQRGGETD